MGNDDNKKIEGAILAVRAMMRGLGVQTSESMEPLTVVIDDGTTITLDPYKRFREKKTKEEQ